VLGTDLCYFKGFYTQAGEIGKEGGRNGKEGGREGGMARTNTISHMFSPHQGLDETYLDVTSLIDAQDKEEQGGTPSSFPPSFSSSLPPSSSSSFAGHLYTPPTVPSYFPEGGEGGREGGRGRRRQQQQRCVCGCVRRLKMGSQLAEVMRQKLFQEVR